MKAVVLPVYNKNVLRAMLSLKVDDLEIPKPGPNEVLVKTYAAACNPSDIAFIQGTYNIVKAVPAIPGFEASGEIVDAGEKASHLIGKKVSAFVQNDTSGTWAEYFTAPISDIIILDEKMPMEQAACFTVNPFTAYAMYNLKPESSSAILQNASGSQVAAFIRSLAKKDGIKVIDIVRKQKTADKLMSEGAENVLVETDDNFDEKLNSVCSQLKPTMAYDAVGGSLSGKMFNAMHINSELVVYGGLSNKDMSDFSVMDAIFNGKKLSGFNLIDWKLSLNEGEFDEVSKKLQQLFISGQLKTNIISRHKPDDIIKGIKTYIGNMSGGKLLIKM